MTTAVSSKNLDRNKKRKPQVDMQNLVKVRNEYRFRLCSANTMWQKLRYAKTRPAGFGTDATTHCRQAG